MVQSVTRALGLLEQVATHEDWVGVRELAREVGLKAPTAHNLLRTLASKRFLEFDEQSGRYRVGLAVLLLARRVERLPRLAAFARPYLERVFAEVGETTVVCALIAGRVVIVDYRQGNQPVSVAHHESVIEHPHTLASGKLLLAFCDRAVQLRYAKGEPLGKLGPNVPRTVTGLLDDLRKVRSRGYAEAVDARGYGIGAVAVPVFGPGHEVEVTLACSAPVSRFGRERRRQVLSRLLQVAAEMETSLGGRAGGCIGKGETSGART
jgi:IclR family KDG regulon transcriptional repressor